MQVLQVQQAMAAQAAAKQKEAEALIQAKIDAEVPGGEIFRPRREAAAIPGQAKTEDCEDCWRGP